MTSQNSAKSGRPKRGDQAAGYVQPGRIGKRPLVGYFEKDAHTAIKQLALDLDRKIEDLMREAFRDLLLKHERRIESQLFKDDLR